MVSGTWLKRIRALGMKKYRDAEGLFVGEGPKVVDELMSAFPCVYLVGTEEGLKALTPEKIAVATQVEVITEAMLSRLSFLQHPQHILGVFTLPASSHFPLEVAQSQLCIALDGVQDPGNVGTILRVADWWGIEHIVCSPDTADAFAPKVVQASMGAVARIHVYRCQLPDLLMSMPDVPVYGTFLDGKDIYQETLTSTGLIVMGNEGKGIRQETEKRVTHRLLVPSFPAGRPTSESLNVAIATAVVCAEFRRRSSQSNGFTGSDIMSF